MKRIVIALTVVAVAGCAELPESVKHSFAAHGATTQADTPDVGTTQQAGPYPYNSPYGS
ncbi:MAG TPA: hypothetical protein VEQ87_23635 [Burkholderiales bacterium]|nr:hypothetical protein [Burkholderiales bacterium]